MCVGRGGRKERFQLVFLCCDFVELARRFQVPPNAEACLQEWVRLLEGTGAADAGPSPDQAPPDGGPIAPASRRGSEGGSGDAGEPGGRPPRGRAPRAGRRINFTSEPEQLAAKALYVVEVARMQQQQASAAAHAAAAVAARAATASAAASPLPLGARADAAGGGGAGDDVAGAFASPEAVVGQLEHVVGELDAALHGPEGRGAAGAEGSPAAWRGEGGGGEGKGVGAAAAAASAALRTLRDCVEYCGSAWVELLCGLGGLELLLQVRCAVATSLFGRRLLHRMLSRVAAWRVPRGRSRDLVRVLARFAATRAQMVALLTPVAEASVTSPGPDLPDAVPEALLDALSVLLSLARHPASIAALLAAPAAARWTLRALSLAAVNVELPRTALQVRSTLSPWGAATTHLRRAWSAADAACCAFLWLAAAPVQASAEL